MNDTDIFQFEQPSVFLPSSSEHATESSDVVRLLRAAVEITKNVASCRDQYLGLLDSLLYESCKRAIIENTENSADDVVQCFCAKTTGTESVLNESESQRYPLNSVRRIQSILPKVTCAVVILIICKTGSFALTISRQGWLLDGLPNMPMARAKEIAKSFHLSQSGWQEASAFQSVVHLLSELLLDRVAYPVHLMCQSDRVKLGTGNLLIFVGDPSNLILPIAATSLNENQYFSDYYKLAYVPDLIWLQRLQSPPVGHMLKNYTGFSDSQQDLAATFFEIEECKEHFPADSIHVTGTSVTSAAIREAFLKCHVMHWSSHAVNVFINPLQSGLLFSESNDPPIFTLKEIHSLPETQSCKVVLLVGCQTAITAAAINTESLVLGFLRRGVSCVLGTLWPVGNSATFLFIRQFMLNWRKYGQSVSQAIASAQIWLRVQTVRDIKKLLDVLEKRYYSFAESTYQPRFPKFKAQLLKSMEDFGASDCPFESPYYWAPFVAVGQSWSS